MKNNPSPIRFLLVAVMLTGTVLVAGCTTAKMTPETPGTPHGCSPATTPCQ